MGSWDGINLAALSIDDCTHVLIIYYTNILITKTSLHPPAPDPEGEKTEL